MLRPLKKLVILLAVWQFAAIVVTCAGWLRNEGEALSEAHASVPEIEGLLAPGAALVNEARLDLRQLRWFHGGAPSGYSEESMLVKRLAAMPALQARTEAAKFFGEEPRSALVTPTANPDAFRVKLDIARQLHRSSSRFHSLDQWLWLLMDEAPTDEDRARIAAMLASYRDGDARVRLLQAALRLGAAGDVWTRQEKARLLLAMGGAIRD